MDDIVRKELLKAFSAQTMEEQTTTADAGVYIQPQVWAKNAKNWRPLNDPTFPKYGGPGAKYVKVKDKCKTFPYCSQGALDNPLDFYEPVRKKKKKGKKKKQKLTPLGRRKRKIAKDLVRTQKIKTPRGKHYNIGKWINESNGYLYNNELTRNEVNRAILENTMNKKINRTKGKDLEDSVRNHLLNEAETAQGYKIYQKAHAESGKSNTEGLEIATKKIKEFMKDTPNETDPKMYRNNSKQNEYIEDVYYSSGMSGLEYDQPLSDEQKERHKDYLEGSAETGNATKDVAGVMTKNSEGGDNTTGEMLRKAAIRRAEKKAIGNKLANNNRRYTPDTVVTTSNPIKESKLPILRLHEHVIDTAQQIFDLTPSAYKVNGREFSVTNGTDIKKVRYENYVGKEGGHIIILDSINPQKINEQMDRMKALMSHDINAKDKRFR